MNLQLNKAKKVVEKVAQQATDIDVETIQKSLLQKNAIQSDFVSEFQCLFDDISNAISKEFFNSQYKETRLVKKLKDLQTQSSKAKSIDELIIIRKNFDSLIGDVNHSKNIDASRQLGINALIKRK